MVAALHGFFRFGRFVNGVVFGKKHLLLTNAVISTAMGAFGDGLQQHYDLLCGDGKTGLDAKASQFNWTRTFHMSCAGFTTGMVTHYWYIFLDSRLGTARNLGLVCKKVLFDQIVFSPVNLATYFATLGICERSSLSKVKDELLEKGMQQIYVAEWFIWPPAQFFNFYCLPMKYRILFDNVISLGFDIYSPYVKYKTELRKETEAKLKALQEPGATDLSR
ncbi:Mpv17-like protein 2 [Halotydeus destructor]|nr:Mpv17-like protein 2 [Halotydeus destructor]